MTNMKPNDFQRGYLLDDCVARATSDGEREIVAYAAVFDKTAEIRDHEGHYFERIGKTAFDQTLRHHPNGQGIKAMFNHGLTVHGTPSERYSMPFGVPTAVRADGRGLLTTTQVANTDLGDEVYELAKMGGLTEMSFRGRVFQDKELAPARGNDLRTVERTEIGLVEFGPVALTGAYGSEGAQILQVRSDLPIQDILSTEQLDELRSLLTTDPGLAVSGTATTADSYVGTSKHERQVKLAQMKGMIPHAEQTRNHSG